jgi:hypothetical protein
MEKYYLLVDNKITVWRRDKVMIKAESLEEAINIAESGEYDDCMDVEYLDETEVYLRPEENNGEMTCEIMDRDGKTLWHNGNE